MILAGTCGFCEARRRYFKYFPTVEVQQTFYKILQEKTLQKWREEAPEDFIFSIKAFQGITHPSTSPTWRRSNVKPSGSVGLLRPAEAVFKYWELTLKEAKALGAGFILIQLPKSFKESEESFTNAEKFFTQIDRGDFEIAVELRGWSEEGIKKFVKEFDLIDVADPIIRKPLHGKGINYYRLHGSYQRGRIIYKHKYSEKELREIVKKVKKWDKEESYIYFNNAYMCDDAKRFIQILAS